MQKKIDYSKIEKDIFNKLIFPEHAKDFLINCVNYEEFANILSRKFILNTKQWERILKHWEEKESIINKI